MKATVPTKIVHYADGSTVVSYAAAVDVPDSLAVGRPVNSDGHAIVEFLAYASAKLDRCLAGSSLKALLAQFGLVPQGDCACGEHAAEMDRRGCDWCEGNITTIVGWLREEATKRGLPFLDVAGTVLVRRAISNARRLHRGKAHG